MLAGIAYERFWPGTARLVAKCPPGERKARRYPAQTPNAPEIDAEFAGDD
jgi:hypothetical protein